MVAKCQYCGSDPIYIQKVYANRTRERYLICSNPECLAQTTVATSQGPDMDAIKQVYFKWNNGDYEQPVPPNSGAEEEVNSGE